MRDTQFLLCPVERHEHLHRRRGLVRQHPVLEHSGLAIGEYVGLRDKIAGQQDASVRQFHGPAFHDIGMNGCAVANACSVSRDSF